MFCLRLFTILNELTGRRILHPWVLGTARSKETFSGVFSAQVGFYIPIGEALTGAYYVHIVFFTFTELNNESPNRE